VLTGDYQEPGVADIADYPVRRILGRQLGSEKLNKLAECRKFLRVVGEVQPQLIYFWSQSEICLALAPLARLRGIPAAFFLSDTSFVSWRVGAWLFNWARRNKFIRAVFGRSLLVTGYPIVKGHPCHFASQFLWDVARRHNISVSETASEVIHWGISPALLPADIRERRPARRLLYAGQLIPEKGVHTAIAALGYFAGEAEFATITLTIAGGGRNLEYEKALRALPAQLGIGERVQFLGKIPRETLSSIYREHDILVFPSEWEEPFAITPLEAMAAGLVVVGTLTGGSGELFRDRETAMTFATGDAKDCARAIRELVLNRDLWESISHTGKQEVLEHHTLEVMVDRIEASLGQICGVRPVSHAGEPAVYG